MTTTLQIRVDEKLKKEFLATSKQKGLDGSMLIRHFMKSFADKPEIVNFSIEEDFFNDIVKDKKVIKKLEKISDKLDVL